MILHLLPDLGSSWHSTPSSCLIFYCGDIKRSVGYIQQFEWSKTYKWQMMFLPESGPKMSWPHKTHLELLAGPYLGRISMTTMMMTEMSGFEKEVIFLWKKAIVSSLSNLTCELSSLPVDQSLLQVQSGSATAAPTHLLVQSQRHLPFHQRWPGESMVGQLWWSETF